MRFYSNSEGREHYYSIAGYSITDYGIVKSHPTADEYDSFVCCAWVDYISKADGYKPFWQLPNNFFAHVDKICETIGFYRIRERMVQIRIYDYSTFPRHVLLDFVRDLGRRELTGRN